MGEIVMPTWMFCLVLVGSGMVGATAAVLLMAINLVNGESRSSGP